MWRRVIASRRQALQTALWEDSVPTQMYQARFYDFNVWSGHKEIRKLRYNAP